MFEEIIITYDYFIVKFEHRRNHETWMTKTFQISLTGNDGQRLVMQRFLETLRASLMGRGYILESFPGVYSGSVLRYMFDGDEPVSKDIQIAWHTALKTQWERYAA